MCRSESPVSRSVVIDDRTVVLILFRPLKDLSAEQLVTGARQSAQYTNIKVLIKALIEASAITCHA